jgi:modulator of FtsH protease HflC
MKKSNLVFWGAVAVFILIFLSSSIFIVTETDQVIVTRFGKPIGNPITSPGINFKLPFIEETNFFEKRFLEWDGAPNQVPTKDKRFIWIDAYARWRITDVLLFFQRLRDERSAQSRLDDILDGETRTAVANHDLDEVVRSTNRKPAFDPGVYATDEVDSLKTIKTGREKITREILSASAERVKDLGIELLDLRFKRIDYVEEVREKVYDRMISERKRIADRFRSEGQGEASKILGEKERDLKQITSNAYRQSQEIIGRADAEATKIYANAFNRSDETREFYRFLKTMEIYDSTFTANDWLILSSKSDIFKYLKTQSGR